MPLEKERNFREILLKLEKEGTNKIDPLLYKELVSAINKTQQELNKIRLSNRLKKNRCDRLQIQYNQIKVAILKNPNSNEEDKKKIKFIEGNYNKENFTKVNQEKYGNYS